MPVNTGITPIQDNSTNLRSISKNEKEFIINSILEKKLRFDGRSLTETRPIVLNFNRSTSSSTSSNTNSTAVVISECLVYIGKTKVLAAISCELSAPTYVDRPNEGSIMIKVDLSPMANISFIENDDYGGGGGSGENTKSYYSQRIHRILERVLLKSSSSGSGSGAIDTEALCVLSGKAVWKLNLTITVLDDDGNLIDCALLGAFAALRFLKLPATEIVGEGKVEIYSDEERDPIPLPLHHTPIPLSFALFASSEQQEDGSLLQCIIDPNQREELLCQGFITFCFNKHKELCCIDFSSGGCCSIDRQVLNQCSHLAQLKVMELSNMLETALASADQRLLEERLQRLHEKTFPEQSKQLPPTSTPNVPFWEEIEAMEVDMDDSKLQQQLKKEQQEYRLKALDFDHLHHAASVKEVMPDNDKKNVVSISTPSSSLLQAMIHSANSQPSNYSTMDEDTPSVDNVTTSTDSLPKQEDVVEEQVAPSEAMQVVDDDDEEELTILQNEFTNISNVTTAEESTMIKAEVPKKEVKNVNDIIHDLKKENKKKFKKNKPRNKK